MNKVKRSLLFFLSIDLIFIINALIKGILIGIIEIDLGEWSLITILSVFKLWMISFGCLRIYRIQSKGQLSFKDIFKHRLSIWIILSIGFLFLGLDDLFSLHERLDYFIHEILQNLNGFNGNGLSDRIDDVIILIYLLIGIFILRKSRNQVSKFYSSKKYVITGLYLIGLMVFLDIISNRSDFLQLVMSESLASIGCKIALVLEESCKIFASSFFLAGIYKCIITAKAIKLKPLLSKVQ